MNQRDEIEPATTARTRFDVRSRDARVVLILGAAIAYILVFLTLYSRMGPGLAALSGLPVIVAAWLLGLRAGLVAWFLFLPLNTLLFNLVGMSGWDTVLRNGGGPGTVVTLIIVAVAGRMFDLREQLKREISDRKRAEDALQRSHGKLEMCVTERTAELKETNRELRSEIANRKQVEERETQLGRIVEEALDEILVFDAKTFRFLEVNRGARENLGYSMQELSAMTPLDVKPQVTPEEFMEIVAPLLHGERKRVDFETVHRRKDGSLYNVEAHLELAELDNKTVFVAFARDITDRIRAAIAVSRANHEWHQSFDALPNHLCVLDRSGAILRANKTVRERFEPIHGNLIGLDYRLIYCGTTTPDPQPPCAAVLETGKPVHCESQLPTMEGWYSVSSYPLFDKNKQQWGAVSVVTDITTKWEAEHALRVSEQRFRTLVEHAPEAIVVHDVESNRFVDVNQNAIDLFKLDRESLLNIGPAEISAATQSNGRPSRELAQEFTERALAGEVLVFEWTFLDGEGNEIPAEVRLVRLPSADRKLVRGSVTDISVRKRAEIALKESQATYHDLYDHAPDMYVSADFATGSVVECNGTVLAMTGFTSDEIVNNHIFERFTLDCQDAVQEAFERFGRTGKLQDVALRVKRKDGSGIDVSVNASAIRDAQGNVIQSRSVWRDITARKRAEEALRESNRHLEQTLADLKQAQEQVIRQERLRALGQMAGGVAHDLNNSLSPVLGYAEMIAAAPDLPAKLRGWAGFIETGARDAAAVVERLREFYRPQNPDETAHETVNLKELMAQILELTRPQWRDEAQRTGRSIEFELDLQSESLVNGIPAELREVLTNLVFNAVDAMPSGGKITLRLRSAAEFAVIEVIDTGIGMTADVAGRCFEPFFTAKGSEGTGLGLSVCHGIVQRHGGRFEIDTQPGHGTTMRIFWPLAVQDELAKPEEPMANALPSRRVLYIDDDPRLRQLVSTLLEQLGQQVDLADGGPTGLQMVRANDYDIVITDLGMPDIDGREVTRIVKTTRQNMPVIMVTGWGSPLPQVRVDGDVEPDQLVPKPLTLSKLREALEKAFA